LRRAEVAQASAAGTEHDYAVSVLEAYKHMAEGLTRRWVGVLLVLAGLDGPPPTVGALGPPAAARLGELGARVESALIPAIRNAEAHDDFMFDEGTGLLRTGDATFHPDEILACLTELDILQRALIVGRLAAFADQPELGGGVSGSRGGSSASSAMSFAQQRFGHAGQRVRSFVRDRDRLDIVVDGLRSEACNPCFVALTQTAQVLPTVNRFVIRVPDRDGPVIDVTSSVLRENWGVFVLATKYFSDGLPQATFLPSLTWARLACEPVEEAARDGGLDGAQRCPPRNLGRRSGAGGNAAPSAPLWSRRRCRHVDHSRASCGSVSRRAQPRAEGRAGWWQRVRTQRSAWRR
jgi:hypothetical protein